MLLSSPVGRIGPPEWNFIGNMMMASPAGRLVRLRGLDFAIRDLGARPKNGMRNACAPAGVVQPDANVMSMDA